ncbi:hypothetical protein BpHYR1_041017 [Brachionus plicatilis]|uniref:Uncharacterized protein n=1 Tax=Brachionus plicatilis TaxID=10195 RepID=A0A3M7R345_BRAPC|nr:hypothetical protein BpHYR1_041017 [Brachionus plicatilis]
MSCSRSRKLAIISGASGIRKLKFLYISRQALIEGISGSRSSGSLSLHKNLRVEPRINSFGCCRSLLYASQTRIISCINFPSGVFFGTISQKMSKSFLRV